MADNLSKTIDFKTDWPTLGLPAHVMEVLSAAPALYVPNSREDLLDWALGRDTGTTDWNIGNREDMGEFESVFDVPGVGPRGGSGGDEGAQRAGGEFS